jgi:hypothetical protein
MGKEESGVWRITELDEHSPHEVARVVGATFTWLGAWVGDAIVRVLPGRAPQAAPTHDAFAASDG